MSKSKRLAYVKKHWGKRTPDELAEALGVTLRTIWRYKLELGLPGFKPETAEELVDGFKDKQKLSRERRRTRELAKRVSELEAQATAAKSLEIHDGYYKIPHNKCSEHEAVAVIVASDWHIEEVVHKWQVNNLNHFNEKVCAERVKRFFQHGLKLVLKQQEHIKIERLVLALLGDFISGSIHEELMEGNRLLPVDAIIEMQRHLASGIRYLLENSDLKEIIVPCHSGNHGRMTPKRRVSTEAGNSLERLLYHSLSKQFEDEPRVRFLVSEGYHSYVKVWPDFIVRFHHGHSVRYYGGVGGLTIPVNKAIAGWNKGRHADLDVLGHFHTFFDGGNFVVNGSLVGYNAYALSIKASPELPKQAFFLIDKVAGKTVVCPIILDHDR